MKRMHAEGMTFTEIAEATGYHRTTVSEWIRNGGPPPKRQTAPQRVVMTDRWQGRIADLVREHPALLATSIHDVLAAEGFAGSYATVVRQVRRIRGPRFKAATSVSLPIETPPGLEAQFDFADVTDVARSWGWEMPRLWCFGMILCWSRWRRWWFTTSVDREHTFEGIVGFVEAAGGAPRVARTDRMGALGTTQGRRFTLHPPTLAFARHYGVVIQPCRAGDAKRKGKVERPFRQLREGFLAEQALNPPTSIAQLNRMHGLEGEGLDMDTSDHGGVTLKLTGQTRQPVCCPPTVEPDAHRPSPLPESAVVFAVGHATPSSGSCCTLCSFASWCARLRCSAATVAWKGSARVAERRWCGCWPPARGCR